MIYPKFFALETPSWTSVFASLRTNQHNDEWLEAFTRGVRDIAEYDRVYKRRVRVAELYDVSSSSSMEQLEYTTAIPLPLREER